jgi:hypothetical protein
MRRTWLPAASLALSAAIVGPALAFAPMDGCFAAAVCPAVGSIRTASNPGGIVTEVRNSELRGVIRRQAPGR